MKNVQLTNNFNISEFACKDGSDVPDKYECNVKILASQLQIIRDHIGKSIHINSGYRSPEYNKRLEGSAVQSQHLLANAADITTVDYSPKEFADLIEKLIAQGKLPFIKGLGRYKGFTHIDCRAKKARWGKN